MPEMTTDQALKKIVKTYMPQVNRAERRKKVSQLRKVLKDD